MRSYSLAVVLFLVLSLTALAQSATAPVTGKIADEGGSPLPGATVTFVAGQRVQTFYTDRDGAFTAALEPGTYTVRVEAPGFRTTTEEDLGIPAEGKTLNFSLSYESVNETMVVTASKAETSLIDAPATVSVITSQQLAASPANNYGDMLRTVPGLNVIQLSARDINVTAREASTILANTQLALLDGRSVYQDFFGFVLWDLLPIDFSEISQVEVVRGPASAVWGANALNGVVNIRTKSPFEMEGTRVALSAGILQRANNEDSGGLYTANITHTHAINENLAYRLSLGYVNEDAFSRPQGTVPVDPERGTGGAVYPPYQNEGTSQPKFEGRLDQKLSNGGMLSYSGGYSGTSGLMASAIGPFRIDNSKMGFGMMDYTKDNMKLSFYANFLSGSATNLLTMSADGSPVAITFKNQTYDIDFSDSRSLDRHNTLTYGGNFRRNNFDLSAAPAGQDRNEAGAYVQDDIMVLPFEFVVGGRVDKLNFIDGAVFSPRVAMLFHAGQDHTIRASYNRAFRSPSLVENSVQFSIIAANLDLGLLDPRLQGYNFPVITQVVGNDQLNEESLDAFELSYSGHYLGSSWSAAFFVNNRNDVISFVNPPGAVYTSQNPPPGWPLDPRIIDLLAMQGYTFPSEFTYQNQYDVRNKGVELSFDQQFGRGVSLSVNYSYLADPVILRVVPGAPEPAPNLPPTNRFNIGVNFDRHRYLGNVSLNCASNAFWTDVLNAPYWGPSDSYAMLNATFGVRWMDGRLVTSVKATNLTNEDIQQHVFGDVLKRTITAQVEFNF